MTRLPLLAAAAVVAGCAIALATSPASAAAPSPVSAESAMVVSAHPEATAAGVAVLRAGGNAADAAVAVAFALSVVEPYSSGIGGGGFSLYFDADKGKVAAVDGRETAPEALTEAHFHPGGVYDPKLSRWTGLAVGVPGLVAQMHALHARFGTRPFAELTEPARRLCAEGFEVTELLRDRIEATRGRLSPAARKLLLHGDVAPRVGTRLFFPDKAAVFDRIARDGVAGFYEGATAEAIVAGAQAAGGVITLADLAGYQPRWREPLRGTWRGLTVYSFPPPSSGGAVLLRMLHGVGDGAALAEAGWHAAESVHILAELMKRAYADRNLLLGDPDHVAVPLERFVPPAVGQQDRAAVGKKATPAEKILDPSKLHGAADKPHTSHFSIVDARGNAVSQTQTINLSFGAGLVAEGGGFLLNNEMDDFATSPGRPNAFGLVQGRVNAVAAGKRPLSSMTPTLVLRGDRLDGVVGTPGGSRIITSVFQTLLNRYVFGMDVAAAVCAPRVHHQWLPDKIFAEPRALSPDTVAALRARRHVVEEIGEFCNVQAIFRDGDRWSGAPDCRGEGAAEGF